MRSLEGSAMPPSVRKGYAFPSGLKIFYEAMPPTRRSLKKERAKRKGTAFPHGMRHSRSLTKEP